jgi:hypothetical protein
VAFSWFDFRDSGDLLDRGSNAAISAAPADIAAHGLVDIGIGGFGGLFEQRRGSHYLAGLAIAALRYA